MCCQFLIVIDMSTGIAGGLIKAWLSLCHELSRFITYRISFLAPPNNGTSLICLAVEVSPIEVGIPVCEPCNRSPSTDGGKSHFITLCKFWVLPGVFGGHPYLVLLLCMLSTSLWACSYSATSEATKQPRGTPGAATFIRGTHEKPHLQ